MLSVKEKITDIIQALPADSTYDEILKELAFHRTVEKGLDDSRKGKTISNEEMKRRIKTWAK